MGKIQTTQANQVMHKLTKLETNGLKTVMECNEVLLLQYLLEVLLLDLCISPCFHSTFVGKYCHFYPTTLTLTCTFDTSTYNKDFLTEYKTVLIQH